MFMYQDPTAEVEYRQARVAEAMRDARLHHERARHPLRRLAHHWPFHGKV